MSREADREATAPEPSAPTSRRQPHIHDDQAVVRRSAVVLRAARAVAHSQALLQQFAHTADVTEQGQIDREVRDSEQAYLREHQQALLDAELAPPRRTHRHGWHGHPSGPVTSRSSTVH